MRDVREQTILIISIIIIFFVIILNAYNINLLKSEVYESHYTEEAELMLEGIKKFYIGEGNEELERLAKKDIIINSLKTKDNDNYQVLENYMLNVDEYIDYEFIAVFDKDKEKLFSDSSKEVDENSIIEAYKSMYIDNFSESIIVIPLIKNKAYYNNMFFRKNIVSNGEILGSILLATSGEDIIEFMKHFDEVSFILDPSGEIYIGSEVPTDDFANFIKVNNKNELEMQGKRKYNDFYFDVFKLNNDGWKIVILQSLTQVKFSSKISVLLSVSHIFTTVLLILLVLIIKIHKHNVRGNKQLITLTSALKKTKTKISIVKDDSEIVYSNHDDFNLIYQNPDNLYFKSDILAAIRKDRDFEKRYSFEIDGQRKWFLLHLNMLDVFESCNCAVISLNEFTNERLYQKRLESIALYDNLTGCYNRDQGLNKINDDIKNENSINELSMIFLDIDDLKYVNDNMGHNMGDILIKTIINTVKDFIRANDYCIRIGGDEFLVILPNCSYPRAAEIILMIEDQVAKLILPEYNHKPSFSFGLVSKDNDENFNLESMINEADAKMYINKKIKKAKLKKMRIFKSKTY